MQGLQSVLLGKGMAQHAKGDAAPGGKGHLCRLQVEAGVREHVQVAGVVIVHMADDDVFDAVGLYPDFSQTICWTLGILV